MVCVDFKDAAKLAAEAQQGAQMGFTGKQAIHPSQVEPIYAAFRPPEVRPCEARAGEAHVFSRDSASVSAGQAHPGGECQAPGGRAGRLLDRWQDDRRADGEVG